MPSSSETVFKNALLPLFFSSCTRFTSLARRCIADSLFPRTGDWIVNQAVERPLIQLEPVSLKHQNVG